MTVDFEKIKQMSIKDVQREINRCFLTYNFEDAEVLYEIWKDHLDGKEYIKRKQIYLNKKINKMQSKFIPELKIYLDRFDFIKAEEIYQKNESEIGLEYYIELINHYKIKQETQKNRNLIEAIENLLRAFRFHEADVKYKKNRNIMHSTEYLRLKNNYLSIEKAQLREKALVQIKKHLADFEFINSDAEYHKNKHIIRENEYYDLRAIYLNKQKEIAKKEKEKLERELEIEDALKNLNSIMEYDYINSRSLYQRDYKNIISEKAFTYMQIEFVVSWFEKNNLQVPDKDQAAVIANVWDNIKVIARAGSGKTTTITSRVIFLVRHCGIEPSKILLLAFNRDAAQTINNRLEIVLSNNLPFAMTFHAFAKAVVQPEEQLIYDSITDGMKKSSTVQSIIDKYLKNYIYGKKIESVMLKYFRSSWDELNKKGFLLSKKEMLEYRRNLTEVGLDGKYYKSYGEKKIADLLFERDIKYKYEKNYWWNGINYKPDFSIELEDATLKSIIIEYFGMEGDLEYDKQSEEKRKYWKDKGEYIFCEINKKEIRSDYIEKIEKILRLAKVKFRKLDDDEIWTKIKTRAIDEFTMMLSDFINRCRMKIISPDELGKIVSDNIDKLPEVQIDLLRITWKIYVEYLKTLSENNEEDFNGLLIRATDIIGNGKTTWNRKSGTGDIRTLSYLFIDEFQDFSPLFNKLVNRIVEQNKRLKLCCVGDDWQAINGFAGSDLSFFYGFEKQYENAIIEILQTNYRSADRIVKVSNALMAKESGDGANSTLSNEGESLLCYLDKFEPDAMEKKHGDDLTPLLIRIAFKYSSNGKNVQILCRKNAGIPFYVDSSYYQKNDFKQLLIEKVKAGLPENLRERIREISTVHSYKGLEEDVIILLDAVKSCYPLLHPRNAFFEILGYSIKSIIEEEKRLFYVAITRAKTTLILITEEGNETEFISEMKSEMKILKPNSLKRPPVVNNNYTILIKDAKNSNNGTLLLKNKLKLLGYKFDRKNKNWVKEVPFNSKGERTLIQDIKNEMCDIKARNIDVTMTGCDNNEMAHFMFDETENLLNLLNYN